MKRSLSRLARLGLPAALAATAAGAVGLAALAPSAAAAAQAWPDRPVRIVIAVGPGSTGDTIARLLAPHLQELWKQPVIVENRPGAGGIVGTEAVVNAKDGHTLLFGSQSSILPKYTQRSLRFDPLTDLVPIYRFIDYDMILGTNAETAARAKTLADLVALSKSTEKGIFFAGTGPTSVFNVSTGVVNQSMGMRYTAVNYNNVGAMTLAVLRNDAQLFMNTPSSVKGQIEQGTIVPLAAVSTRRLASLPDVPTLAEAIGYKGYIPLVWAGFFAPKGTPPDVVERIANDVRKLANDDAVRAEIERKATGRIVRDSSAPRYTKEIHDETLAWEALFKAIDFQPE